jgi:hypothetical protein
MARCDAHIAHWWRLRLPRGEPFDFANDQTVSPKLPHWRRMAISLDRCYPSTTDSNGYRGCKCDTHDPHRPHPIAEQSEASCAASASAISWTPAPATKSRRLTIAQRDRACLVQKQNIYVTSCLDGTPRRREHVCPHHPTHASNADIAMTSARPGRTAHTSQSQPSPCRPELRSCIQQTWLLLLAYCVARSRPTRLLERGEVYVELRLFLRGILWFVGPLR